MTGWIPCHIRNFLKNMNLRFFYQHIQLLPHLVLKGMGVVVPIDQLIAVAKTVHFLVHLPECFVQAILLCVRQVNI